MTQWRLVSERQAAPIFPEHFQIIVGKDFKQSVILSFSIRYTKYFRKCLILHENMRGHVVDNN